MAWVCGKPCNSSSGGPEPPRRRRMEISSVSTISSWNPSNTAPSLVSRDHLEAPCDAFTGVIHEGQYVLARLHVQRLLVKSVRLPKVSAIEMPVERGVAAACHGLQNRAAAYTVE